MAYFYCKPKFTLIDAGKIIMTAKKIASNAAWNLVGQVLPIGVAVLAIPLLISKLGVERFGFLSLAWALVGYAGLFDFGISRAMTRIVARYLAEGDAASALHSAKVGTTMMLIFGFIIAIIVGSFSGPIVRGWLHVPPALEQEAVSGLIMLAISIPVVLLTAAYRGILEAWQAFRPLNIIKIFMGFLTYLGPLLVAFFSPNLEYVLASMTLMRLVAAYWHAHVCFRECGRVLPWQSMDKPTIKELFSLGGWISVSNVVSPLMTYMDRFILAGLVAVQVVAYYVTPYDMVTKILVFPYSVMAVLFPILAGQKGNGESSRKTYSVTIRLLFLSMFPLVFSIVIWAEPLLMVWLGSDFAKNSALIMQILVIGVLANALAQAPANVIQASGNPKWMALVHLVELPIFLGILWFATKNFGVIGTAASWAGRMIVDAGVLYWIAARNINKPDMHFRWYLVSGLMLVGGCALAFCHMSIAQKALTWSLAGGAFMLIAWKEILVAADRQAITELLLRRSRA